MDDEIAAERDEMFHAVIENIPPGVSVGPIGRTNITIVDNDGG